MSALDPRLNLRIFPAGAEASLAAAEAWLGEAFGDHAGAWNILADAGPNGGGRTRFSGSRGEIAALSTGDRAFDSELAAAWAGYQAALRNPAPPLVMGILNVTPDSFSDGGLWIDVERAVERGLEMIEQGADVVDIGGESTRPGAEEVPAEEELRRVLPVVEKLHAATAVPISIDTRKSAVARPCLEAGASWINDVSGLTFDPALADLAAARPEVRLVLMHSRAKPADEVYSTEWDASGPVYEDVVADTLRRLRRQATFAVERGVRPEQLWLDPGVGFGKTFAQNVELLRRLREYTSAGLPVLVGTSRKSTVGRLLGDLPAAERLEGTSATVAWAVAEGAAAIRVHDVKEMARVARVAHALRV